MADNSFQDVPSRGMEIVKIFLAASSRGDTTSFILETSKGKLITKYRSVENVAGVPASNSTHTKRRR